MSAVPGRWQPKLISPDVRRMAEAAAREAGLSLKPWLARAIRQASRAEHVPPQASPAAVAAKALTQLAETLRPGGTPPLDEARAYARLVTEFRLSVGEIAAGVDRPRQHVVRALRLLALPQSVRQLIEERVLSADHAYALSDAPDAESLARAVRALGLAIDAARASSGNARTDKGRG